MMIGYTLEKTIQITQHIQDIITDLLCGLWHVSFSLYYNRRTGAKALFDKLPDLRFQHTRVNAGYLKLDSSLTVP